MDFSSYNVFFLRTLQEVPVIYGLIKVTPRTLLETVLGIGVKTFRHNTIGQLFPKIVDQEDLKVIFNFNVVGIKSKLGKLEVESYYETMEFDYLFWSGLPSDFQKVAHVRFSKLS